MTTRIKILLLFCLSSCLALGQAKIEGYAFETGNRGFIKSVNVTLTEKKSGVAQYSHTDENGKYEFVIGSTHGYIVKLEHDLFATSEIEVAQKDIVEGETIFLSHEMKREPGYIFEITLAEKNREPNAPKDQMKGALIEVYNNTKEETILIIDSLIVPDFKIDLKKGNHYTLLVRHPQFLTKRMEAFVNVEGCILCFEGIGDVRPGVSDNLTEGNSQGTLLANVEMEKYFDGKIISLSNIYYKYNDFNITTEASEELKKVAIFINDNPNIEIELSSHTDSRGRSDYNLNLSQQRSEAAVRYLMDIGKVNPHQVTAQGYGENRLINGCSDGAKCTEDEHKKNRRTELKLLKIENLEKFKTLETMKREEKFELMLRELEFGSGSQIRANSKHDLPPSNGDHANREVDSKDVKQSTEQKEHIISSSSSSSSSEKSTQKTTNGYDSEKTISEAKVSSSAMAQKSSDFSGFRLVIHFSRFPLPETHPIFKDNDDVLDYMTKDNNHLYMIGDFKRRKDANKHLKRSILIKYPSAYLVGFADGIRVE